MEFTFETLQEHILQLHAYFNALAADVDSSKSSYLFALAFIAFNPVFWNIVARTEYYTHFLTKLTGSPYRGCYLLAATIFSLGIARDLVYERAISEQPTSPLLIHPYIQYLAIVLFGFGNTLVLSSMWALGVTGTYLGDYFGILMDHRVTGFPFNVTDNPMYEGSVMCFIATGLWYGKPAGLFASLFVHVMYKLALLFEEPFTGKIYENKAKEEAKKKI